MSRACAGTTGDRPDRRSRSRLLRCLRVAVRRLLEDLPGPHLERVGDVDELARRQCSPEWICAHWLAGHHHEWLVDSLFTMNATAEAACVLKRLSRGSLKEVEGVCLWVAKCPQAVRRREHEVDRNQPQVRSHPGTGCLDPCTDISVPRSDLARDERKEALGVGVPFEQSAATAEVRLECGQVFDNPVMGEQPPLLLEGMRVEQVMCTGGSKADVREERIRGDLARLAPELRVVVSGDRLLADVGRPLSVEPAQTGPVWVAVTLSREAVGCVEQPERCPSAHAPGTHTEQATHD